MRKSIALMAMFITCNALGTLRFQNNSKTYDLMISGKRLASQTIKAGDYADLFGTVLNVKALDQAGQPLKDSKGNIIQYEIPKQIIQPALKNNKTVILNVSHGRIEARMGSKFKYKP